MMKSMASSLSLLLALSCLAQLAANAAAAPLVIGIFVRFQTDAIANQLNLWKDQGLEPTYVVVPNSVAAYQALGNGTYDVLFCGVDNTIGRRLTNTGNFTAIGGGTNGAGLALWARAGITSPKQLKGKVLGVDAPTSGYAYAVYKVLMAYGLQPNRDYTILPIGGTPLRVPKLQAGEIDATIFTTPYTEIQVANNTQNLTQLALIPDYFAEYQDNAYSVRADTVRDNTTALYQRLVGLLTVQLQARLILQLSKSNSKAKSAVIKAIKAEFNVSSSAAELMWKNAVGPNGFLANPNLTISNTQVLASAYIRQQFSGFFNVSDPFQDLSPLLAPGGILTDYSIRDAALARVQQQAQDPTSTYSQLVAQWKARAPPPKKRSPPPKKR